MDEIYNSHYVRADGRRRILYGFSDAFEQPQDGDILHNEQGGRHFQLRFADGSLSMENPWLRDDEGVPRYELGDSGFAVPRPPGDIEADKPPPDPGLATLYTEHERIDFLEGWMEGAGYEPS